MDNPVIAFFAKTSLLSVFLKGGLVMWPLLAASILAQTSAFGDMMTAVTSFLSAGLSTGLSAGLSTGLSAGLFGIQAAGLRSNRAVPLPVLIAPGRSALRTKSR